MSHKLIITLAILSLMSFYPNCFATEPQEPGNLEITSASAEDIRWRDELLPFALQWIDETIQTYADKGRALTPDEIEIARKVGVTKPHLVRIHFVDRIPLPHKGKIAETLKSFGFNADIIRGMTMDKNHLHQCGPDKNLTSA